MSLREKHIENVIAECEPVLVRNRISTREFETIFNRKRMVENTYETKVGGVGKSSWAIKLETKQLLMVFSENNTIAIYDISKNKKWSKSVMSMRVDNYMEKVFAELAYSEMVDKKLSKSWFWNRIDFYKKAWVGKVNYTRYYKEKFPFYNGKRVVYVYDHKTFDNKRSRTANYISLGYTLMDVDELKAA